MDIKVDLGAFTRDMRAMRERLLENMAQGVLDAAGLVERAARENLKGDARATHLMQSIHHALAGESVLAMQVRVKVGVGAATGIDDENARENFGIYVHEGTGIYSRTGMGRPDTPWFYLDVLYNGHITSGMQSNPFLENAMNSEGQRVAQTIADALMKG